MYLTGDDDSQKLVPAVSEAWFRVLACHCHEHEGDPEGGLSKFI